MALYRPAGKYCAKSVRDAPAKLAGLFRDRKNRQPAIGGIEARFHSHERLDRLFHKVDLLFFQTARKPVLLDVFKEPVVGQAMDVARGAPMGFHPCEREGKYSLDEIVAVREDIDFFA